jgi:hypothetical protein
MLTFWSAFVYTERDLGSNNNNNNYCFKPANLFLPNFQRKRFKIKQIGRLKSVYLVQSLHAPHSKYRTPDLVP